MSYSFTVRAKNKNDAMSLVTHELVKVVQGQPVHEKDMYSAYQAACLFIELLDEDPASDVTVTVSGSVSWDTPDISLRWASINVSAALRAREEK